MKRILSNPNLGHQEIPGSLFQDGEVFLRELGRNSNKKHLFLFLSCICLPRPPNTLDWSGNPCGAQIAPNMLASSYASTGHEYLVRISNYSIRASVLRMRIHFIHWPGSAAGRLMCGAKGAPCLWQEHAVGWPWKIGVIHMPSTSHS